MIGVIADPADEDVVREFFELFKTPWEFQRRDRHYDVLLCAGDRDVAGAAKLVVVYAGGRIRFDEKRRVQTNHWKGQPRIVSYRGSRIPIYGDTTTFPEEGNALLTDQESQQCLAFWDRSSAATLARIGFNLFSEIRALLTVGQPAAQADAPTLDLHIAFLRDLITASGVSVVEIPPVPVGYQFTTCLTHDVDHPSIGRHKWDHTVFGFLYRASFGSVRKVFRGEMPVRDLLKNWAAGLKLPFVYIGLAKDFWREFDDCYLDLERGLTSTYFVIPYKNDPGRTLGGPAPGFRASSYAAKELEEMIRKLRAANCEVGLHGIDAWFDSAKGREELEEIRRLTGISEIGVRMHWLYFQEQSPEVLENAGAAYDSTIGYNETAGYRAGTSQAYKPLNANHMLELPLHAMDTALFYANYLALSPKDAAALLHRLADNSAQFGGCLTINWHDRSLAPERLWGECYRDFIQHLKRRGAWFATARQATEWFQKRRSATFEMDSVGFGGVRVKVAADHRVDTPGLRLRVYNARSCTRPGNEGSEAYVDLTIDESEIAHISS